MKDICLLLLCCLVVVGSEAQIYNTSDLFSVSLSVEVSQKLQLRQPCNIPGAIEEHQNISTQKTSLIKNRSYAEEIISVEVSRNPEQVFLTMNNKYAFIRCFLSNVVEVVDISSGVVAKSLSIPCPKYMLLNKDRSKLFVASITDKSFPTNPPSDDCSTVIIGITGNALLTTVDVDEITILKTDTIHTPFLRKILLNSSDSILYLVGDAVYEYNNLINGSILREWHFSEQILFSEIDNKNQKIFLTIMDSVHNKKLRVIDLLSGGVQTCQLYAGNEIAEAFYIYADTSGNRVFVQGRINPCPEVLVFDAISLNQLTPIDSASLLENCFLACPNLGSIFVGAFFPNYVIKELDYSSLKTKKYLTLPTYTYWHNLYTDVDSSRLFSFRYGASEDAGSMFIAPHFLDISIYDLKTDKSFIYQATDSEYKCSYTRSFAITTDGRYIVATNSPDNSISILDLTHVGIEDGNNSSALELYPNPTSDIANIRLKNMPPDKYTYEVYNEMGILFERGAISSMDMNIAINLRNFAMGQYFIRVYSHSIVMVSKLIKI